MSFGIFVYSATLIVCDRMKKMWLCWLFFLKQFSVTVFKKIVKKKIPAVFFSRLYIMSLCIQMIKQVSLTVIQVSLSSGIYLKERPHSFGVTSRLPSCRNYPRSSRINNPAHCGEARPLTSDPRINPRDLEGEIFSSLSS